MVVGGLLVGGGAAAAQGATDPVCAALAAAKDAKTKADEAYDEAKTNLTNASSAVVKAEADANAAPNDADLQTALATARALHNQAMTKEASADSTRRGAQMNLNQAVSAAAGKCPPPTTTTTTSKPASGTTSQPPGGTTSKNPGRPDLNCQDFVSRPAAQAVLNQDRSDPYRLDADNDGYACEEFFGDPSKDPDVDEDKTVVHTHDDGSEAACEGDQVTVVPEGSADTGSAL
ncbi:hypothetical protein [Actinomycetospora soli]|uniref:hypothetical protein n=1 Tax=Actinomycetospora soli TaxID=2893887 RepID=UPI001E3F3E25|nr:hypothetical protein [Actinomycetospora soli]MCD2187814.1 hypothetical protein [Actinomycetospora soli]